MTGGPRGKPLFVERHTYRRRRLVDAGRALPVLGLMLWWLPLLWQDDAAPVRASQALTYIFAIWMALPLAAFLLNRAIRRYQDMSYGEHDR